MHLVLTKHKTLPAMTDLLSALYKEFPTDNFSVEGSEDKGYNALIIGAGDERPPRKFAEKFLKNWKPKLV